jgi:hypothetical protein
MITAATNMGGMSVVSHVHRRDAAYKERPISGEPFGS